MALNPMSIAQKNSKQKNSPVNKEAFIQSLIAQMSIDEKLGQLTLYTSDMSVTGPVMRDN